MEDKVAMADLWLTGGERVGKVYRKVCCDVVQGLADISQAKATLWGSALDWPSLSLANFFLLY